MRGMSQTNRSCWQFKVIALLSGFIMVFLSGTMPSMARAGSDCFCHFCHFCHACVQIRNTRASLECTGQAAIALAASAASLTAWVKLDFFRSYTSTLTGVKTRLNN